MVALALVAAAMAPSSARAGTSRPHVIAITLNSEINPVSASFVSDSIKRAENDHAAALVILLDTPGGDSNSMDDIVQDELAATLPVIVYVSPQGGRAASAGVFVTMASDYAAMAPNTNIGAATPIDSSGQNLGSDLRRKVLNDAEAKIRALATSHDRNARAAQLTVRRATSYTADEAAAARDSGTALRSEQMMSNVPWLKTKREPVDMSVADAKIIGPLPRLSSPKVAPLNRISSYSWDANSDRPHPSEERSPQ